VRCFHALSTTGKFALNRMVPSSSASGRSGRPSIRSVAALAGVSAMTVSRVLRNHPRVTADTRARVKKAAHHLGYQPDPQVSKLMHHLRVRRSPGFQAAICALTSFPAGVKFSNYTTDILAGAKRQAETRGYGFSLLHIGENETARTLHRVVRSRGVEGIILLPMAMPVALPDLLDWNAFSVVGTTASVLAPEFHCAIPHHFKNMQLLCRELEARGYHRIGLVLSRDHVERVYHAYNAAVAWHGLYNDRFVAPLIYDGSLPRNLPSWCKQEQPDVVVTNTERLCREFAHLLGRKIPGAIGFASTNTTRDSTTAGIDERPSGIGAVAVDLLTSMIQRGEKGVPAVATSTSLQGRWVTGRSCPRRIKAGTTGKGAR
jgi:DNA-binding LacI/PurR family transcriptional regulator